MTGHFFFNLFCHSQSRGGLGFFVRTCQCNFRFYIIVAAGQSKVTKNYLFFHFKDKKGIHKA